MTEKNRTMTFKGKDAVRSKIVINGNIIEQVNTFRYLGSEILFQGEVDISCKISKFLRVIGLINRTLRNKTEGEQYPCNASDNIWMRDLGTEVSPIKKE